MNSEEAEDASRLDRLFGEFVERLGRGEAIDPAHEVADRPDLVPRAHELFELAKQIATVRPPTALSDSPSIAGFEIGSELGRGGMGAVYRARQVRLGRDVALKTILHPAHSSANRRERFMREARAVARLKHENIVSILDVGEERGVAWFSMELIEGRSLAQVLRSLRDRSEGTGPSGLRVENLMESAGLDHLSSAASYCSAMTRIAIDIARALEHAHSAGVIHRDVKPSNVLLRRDGRAMLTDFGLARVEGDVELTSSGEFLGTPFYVSPEQATGNREDVGPATDVWSLGATLYEMLTLELPFRGTTTHEILEAVRRRDPIPLRRLQPAASRDLEVIVETALSKEPRKRYASMRTLREDLERALVGAPISARPIGSFTRVVRLAKRHKARTVAIGSLIALFTVAPTVLWIQERRAGRLLQRQMQKVYATLDFQETILLAASPDRLGPQATIVDAIRMSRDALPHAYPSDPEIAAMVRSMVGWSLESIGKSEEAYETLEASLEVAEQQLDPRSAERLTLENSLAAVENSLGRPEQCVTRLESVLERIDPDDRTTQSLRITAQMNLANALAQIGDFARAESLLRRAIADATGEDDRREVDLLMARSTLGAILFLQSRMEEAAKLLGDVIEQAKRDGHEAIELRATKYLASVFTMSGQIDPAATMFRRAWSRAREVFGEGSSGELVLRNDLGGISDYQGRFDESEFWYISALRGREAISGIQHPETIVVASNLMQRYVSSRHDSSATRLADEIRTRCEEVFDPRAYPIAQIVLQAAIAMRRTFELERARVWCADSIERIEALGGEPDDHLAVVDAFMTLDAGHLDLAIERLGSLSTADRPGSCTRAFRERLLALSGAAVDGSPFEIEDLPASFAETMMAVDLEVWEPSDYAAHTVAAELSAILLAQVALASQDFQRAIRSVESVVRDPRFSLLARAEAAALCTRSLLGLGRNSEASDIARAWLSDVECLAPNSRVVLDLRIADCLAAIAVRDVPRARLEYGRIVSMFRLSCDPQIVTRALDIAEIEFSLQLDSEARRRASEVMTVLSAAGFRSTARSFRRAEELARRQPAK